MRRGSDGVIGCVSSLFSDAVNFLLDCQFFEAGQRQAQEQFDPALQYGECVPECVLDFFGCSC